MFDKDEQVLARAQEVLQHGGAGEAALTVLQEMTKAYGKLVRQMRRMITMGDRMQEELQRCARTDGLTGISNRRHFMELAQRELSRSQRTGQPMALCILDADYFKKVNDTYGHDAGDVTLKLLAETMTGTVREMDVVARLGGEEFVLLLPETSCHEARNVAERVRVAIATTPVEYNSTSFGVSVSIGLTCSAGAFAFAHKGQQRTQEDNLPTLDQLLQYADIALYAAKKNGRNCVEVYSGTVCTKSICKQGV